MFERFTAGARQVVVGAQEQARELSHPCVGSEHLLLALTSDPTLAPALAGLGLSEAFVRHEVVELVPRGPDRPSGGIPFTPRAKKALERGLREALGLGHDYISSEHLMLAVMHDPDSLAGRIALSSGTELTTIRASVLALLGAETDQPSGPSAGESASGPGQSTAVTRAVPDPAHFSASPDDALTRVLRRAAARAVQAEREHYGVEDVLDAIREGPIGP